MSEHWSEYWRSGHLTSFGNGFKKNYEGELKDFWRAASNNFEEGSTILDVGTGNGALIELIQNNKKFNCFGIDQADIHSGITRSINGTFLSNTSVECLPFDNQTFSNVISQFALEYSRVDEGIDEVFRVLALDGTFIFVCHHPDSIIVKPNIKILKAANFVKSNLEISLRKLVNSLIKKNLLLANQLFEDINEVIFAYSEKEKEALIGTNLPAFIDFLLQNAGNDIDFEKALLLFIEELNLLIVRLTELVRAASSSLNLIKKIKALNVEFEDGLLLEAQSTNIIATYIKGNQTSQNYSAHNS